MQNSFASSAYVALDYDVFIFTMICIHSKVICIFMHMKKQITQLSKDQIDNFQFLLDNHSKQEVAEKLGISKRSVYYYIKILGLSSSYVSQKTSKIFKILANYNK